MRASLRSVLEAVTLADVASGELPDAVRELVADPRPGRRTPRARRPGRPSGRDPARPQAREVAGPDAYHVTAVPEPLRGKREPGQRGAGRGGTSVRKCGCTRGRPASRHAAVIARFPASRRRPDPDVHPRPTKRTLRIASVGRWFAATASSRQPVLTTRVESESAVFEPARFVAVDETHRGPGSRHGRRRSSRWRRSRSCSRYRPCRSAATGGDTSGRRSTNAGSAVSSAPSCGVAADRRLAVFFGAASEIRGR